MGRRRTDLAGTDLGYKWTDLGGVDKFGVCGTSKVDKFGKGIHRKVDGFGKGNYRVGQGRAMNDTMELIKHSAAVNIFNRMTLQQRRTWNVLLYHAHPQLLEHEVHQLSIERLKRDTGYTGHNTDWIKDSFRALATLKIEWDILSSDQQRRWGVCTALAEATIVNNTLCEYSFAPTLRAALHNPTIYTRLNLLLQQRFTKGGALVLWEHLSLCLGNTARMVITRTLDQFRELQGLEDNQYPDFKDLNKRILGPAISEVNDVSDIAIDNVVQIRDKRKVIALEFHLRRKNGLQMLETTVLSCDDSPEYRRLTEDFGLREKDAIGFMDKFTDREYLNEILDSIVEKYQQDKIETGKITAYTKATLSNCAANKPGIEKKIKSRASERDKHEADKRRDDSDLQSAYRQHRQGRARQLIEAMTAAERAALQKEWQLCLVGPLKRRYLESGLSDSYMEEAFLDYVASKRLTAKVDVDIAVFRQHYASA